MEKEIAKRDHLLAGATYHYDADLYRVTYEDGSIGWQLRLYNNDECTGSEWYTLEVKDEEEAINKFCKSYRNGKR